MIEATLEEMAQAHARGLAQVAQAKAEVERLRKPYEAAWARLSKVELALKTIEQGMESAKHDYAIRRALAEARIATEEPPLVFVEHYADRALPQRFELAALSDDGVGLYVHRPRRSYRRTRKQHAIRHVHVPELREASFGKMREAGLVGWEERGRGDFGAGSGSMKPKPPPGGGRWRWLKLREQEALTA